MWQSLYECVLSDYSSCDGGKHSLNLQFPPKYTGVSTSHQEQLNANTLHTALCNYLDVWMEVHECPLAVFTVDPQGKLYLFVQHNKNSHSLLLSKRKQNTWNAGTSIDTVCFQMEEKLRGSKCVCLLLEMLTDITCSWLGSSRPPIAWQDLPAFWEGLSTWACVGFIVFVWAMPKPIHSSSFYTPFEVDFVSMIYSNHVHQLKLSVLLLRAALRVALS